jgi:dienelactone hydrolase
MDSFFAKNIFLLFLPVFFLSLPAYANVHSVQISVSGHGVKEALVASPTDDKKYPAIVFMHGGAIRDKGVPVSTLNKRLLNFSSLGFFVLAPVRTTKEGCCNGDDAIKEGIAIAKSSSEYLRSLPNVEKSKICLIGFSEGALISMWVMTEPNNFSSAVIMSPPNQCGMKRAGSKTQCGRHLINNGKVEKVTKNIIVTLGDKERKGHVKTAYGLSKKLGQKPVIMKGDHKSFLNPRKDVDSLILEQCLK